MSTLLNIDWRKLPNAPDCGTRLCALQDLPDGEIREFIFNETASDAFRMLVLRRGVQLSAYVNQCPHHWLPMNRRDGKFLMWSEQEVMCAHHSAVFNLAEAGVCTMGPCLGSNLVTVPLTQSEDEVLIGS